MDVDPVSAEEASALFAELTGAARVVLAVSGGVDSMALLRLAAAWAEAPGRPELLVATLDHGVREGAEAEAEFVVRTAEHLGLRAFRRRLSLSAGAGHAALRAMRYDALAALCGEHRADALVTAHHRDDQAETVLMRLARGSGLAGLGGMKPHGLRHGFPLHRPLLDLPKARLRATCEALGQTWREDPSNMEPRYARARLRGASDTLTEIGLTPGALTTVSAKLARADRAIVAHAGAILASVTLTAPGLLALPHEALRGPDETVARALALLLEAAGGRERRPRRDAIDAAQQWLSAGGTGRRTLGGCVIEAGETITVHREPGRTPALALDLAPGHEAVLDGRCRVRAGAAGLRLETGRADDLEALPHPFGTSRRAWREALSTAPVWRAGAEPWRLVAAASEHNAPTLLWCSSDALVAAVSAAREVGLTDSPAPTLR